MTYVVIKAFEDQRFLLSISTLLNIFDTVFPVFIVGSIIISLFYSICGLPLPNLVGELDGVSPISEGRWGMVELPLGYAPQPSSSIVTTQYY